MRNCVYTVMTFAALFGMSAVSLAQGVDAPSADLPPPGVYVSPDMYHEYSAMGIILDDPAHDPFEEGAIRERVGDDEIETFDSKFTAMEIGLGLGPITLTGPVQVRTTNRALSTAGLFDTEIVSMSLSGNTPMGQIIIRESPILPSAGIARAKLALRRTVGSELITPRQFGPMMRMFPARATALMRSTRSAPARPPSRKPAEMMSAA